MTDPPGAAPAAGHNPEPRPLRHASPRLTLAVGLYLVVVAILSMYTLIAIFPEVDMKPLTPAQASATNADRKWEALVNLEFNPLRIFGQEVMSKLEPAQGLLFMAFLAGILGSFMHAAQSFAKYVGNEQLTSSWAYWYILRPPVGGMLGLLFYFVLRAGLLSASVEAVSPYGVVAFGALAGWFSKQATDKLAEVFENLFRTEKTGETRDHLSGGAPTITKVTPAAPDASTGTVLLTIEGEHFERGAKAMLGHLPLESNRISSTRLTATVPAGMWPSTEPLTVQNPGPASAPPAP